MLIELILALLIGIGVGTFTGLFPGIHINLVAVMMFGFLDYLLQITSPLSLVVFIVAMSITHTFIDFIPSIFLGAPNEDSFLSILPGHQLLLEGRGYLAVIYTLYGSTTALIIILLFTPFFIYLLPIFYPFIQNIMALVLIILSIYLIASEENILLSTIIFLLAGFLGIASLNLGIKEPLLPLLTGLFGASSLIISIKQKTKIPKQTILPLSEIKLSTLSVIKSVFASIIASPFTAFLPGLGASQAAIIGRQSLQIKDQKEFLFLIGAINTIVMGLSFITFYAIGKMRTGSAVAVAKLMPELDFKALIIILIVIVLSGILSFFLTLVLSKIIARKINDIDYSKISFFILILISIVVIVFSDLTIIGKIIGILIFITSTFLGIFTILKGIQRIHLMGCLLIPTILFYVL